METQRSYAMDTFMSLHDPARALGYEVWETGSGMLVAQWYAIEGIQPMDTCKTLAQRRVAELEAAATAR